MEKQVSDEYSSRLKNYDKLVLGDSEVLESIVGAMPNSQLLEFYEYCVEQSEANVEKSELYWYASLCLEETPVVKMYRNGQLYVDTTLGNKSEARVEESTLTEEDLRQINETIMLLEQRKKEKRNPIKRLLKNIGKK